MSKSGGVSRTHGRSIAEKTLFAGLHLTSVALCAWLLFGGWQSLGDVIGPALSLADPERGLLLLACALLYFGRHLVTLFVLLTRKVALSEVIGLSAFIAVFEIGFLLLGAGALRDSPVPLGWLDGVAIGLVLAGSYLNTWSELQRKWWKQDPVHRGRCYTGGLFGWSMHINYFGDTVLFTGWAMLTQSLFAFSVPAFMAMSFVFFHIPALDAYLAERYGSDFDAYAARTRKFIPFLY
ncbi:methyltransferase family protein [Roseibium sp.]|uniref:methyltransferase family protein n=1 Tax=Roseibium sp. TaxID=1936156 RepID=UPI003BAE9C1B